MKIRIVALSLLGVLACHDSSGPALTAAVATVELSAPAANLYVGTSVEVTARLLDAEGLLLTHRLITWASSDDQVGTVNAGVLTAVAPGSVTVMALSEGQADGLSLSVTAPPANTGTMQLTTITTGDAPDGDGYLFSVASDPAQATGVNATRTTTGMIPGLYVVTLSGLASNCSVTTVNPITVTIAADHTTQIGFQVVCAGPSKRIAFSTTRDGNWEIYAMDPDGSNLTRLTATTTNEQAPKWSRDGRRIVYESDQGNLDLHVMDADGGNHTQLTNTPAINEQSATWSPDGTRIAYSAGGYLFVMNADGTNPTAIGGLLGMWPAWSPDGTRIAFTGSHCFAEQNDVFVVDIDGSNLTQLTTDPSWDGLPAWSPDGSKIAFSSTRTGAFQIFLMNADGTGQTRVSNGQIDDEFPDWSPDGTRLVYQSTRAGSGHWDLFTMKLDGSGISPLTTSSADNTYPSWQR